MKASDAAYEAARVMSERGHCKNRLQDEEGRVCFNGALNVATLGHADYRARMADGSLYDHSAAWHVFLEVTCAAEKILTGRMIWPAYPVSYNNDEHTTGEDVVLLLKEAGAQLEEQGL